MMHLGQQLIFGTAVASLICSSLVVVMLSATDMTWNKLLLSNKRDVLIGSRSDVLNDCDRDVM